MGGGGHAMYEATNTKEEEKKYRRKLVKEKI
jgi:hypothetical protein